MRFGVLKGDGPPSEKADITGFVVRVDKFAATFTRVVLQVDGLYIYVVARQSTALAGLTPGWLVRVVGHWRAFADAYEIDAVSFEVVARRPQWPGRRTPLSFELLGLRSLVVREMHALFRSWDYLPVESPMVVSEWVLGDTVPFEVQFYDRKKYLTISNMVYHQMLACSGFNNFYEIGRLFRRELPSNRKKLAEFTIVDISRVGVGIEAVMVDFEKLIATMVEALGRHSNYAQVLEKTEFATISWNDLVVRSGGFGGDGSQLNLACRAYLNEHFGSFVWVIGFPVPKRPFYTRATNGISHDCQLWYRGVQYLVAGSEIETDPGVLRQAIKVKGSKPDRYRDYLDVVEQGMPLVSMAGMGIERFLALVISNSVTADFAVMPRYQHAHIF
jgi:aspartyl/asparaginyl-tRNA synthetase